MGLFIIDGSIDVSLLLFNVDVIVNVTEGQMQNRRPNVNMFISIIHSLLYLEYIYFVVTEIPPWEANVPMGGPWVEDPCMGETNIMSF